MTLNVSRVAALFTRLVVLLVVYSVAASPTPAGDVASEPVPFILHISDIHVSQ